MEINTGNPAIDSLIARRLAAPKNWRVTAHYADGRTKSRDVESIGQAENAAITLGANKVGRDLIDRDTGETVCIVDVTIDRIS